MGVSQWLELRTSFVASSKLRIWMATIQNWRRRAGWVLPPPPPPPPPLLHRAKLAWRQKHNDFERCSEQAPTYACTQMARALTTCNTSGTDHVQHVWHWPRATGHVPHGTQGQLSCWVWKTWNCICLTLFHWLKSLMDEGGEETPDDELQKKPHTKKAWKLKPQPRLKPAL